MSAPQFREGQQLALGAHHGQIRRLRVALLVVAVFAMLGTAAGAVGLYAARQASENNCVRIHRLTGVGAEIIQDGRRDLEQYRAEGLLSRAQYERAVVQTDRRLARWRSADCPLPPPTPEKTPK